MVYWSQNNGNELPQWYVTLQKSKGLKGSVVFHWHAYLVGTVKCGSVFLTESQVTSLPSIHFSTFVGVAVQAP